MIIMMMILWFVVEDRKKRKKQANEEHIYIWELVIDASRSAWLIFCGDNLCFSLFLSFLLFPDVIIHKEKRKTNILFFWFVPICRNRFLCKSLSTIYFWTIDIFNINWIPVFF
jgi:hypothetical protein